MLEGRKEEVVGEGWVLPGKSLFDQAIDCGSLKLDFDQQEAVQRLLVFLVAFYV